MSRRTIAICGFLFGALLGFLLSACSNPVQPPHSTAPTGFGIVIEITDSPDLPALWQSVESCLDLPHDIRLFETYKFFTAEQLPDGAAGLEYDGYIYIRSDLWPSQWARTMRHEMIHARTYLGHPEVDPLIERCA